MNMLIVAGLMAFGLLAIGTAIFLAMGESKTPPTGTAASSKTASSTTTPPLVKKPVPARQHLPAIREESQVATITTEFSNLTAQLRSLHQQAQEIEHRLSILSGMAEQIERAQASLSIEETEDYRLLEPVDSAQA